MARRCLRRIIPGSIWNRSLLDWTWVEREEWESKIVSGRVRVCVIVSVWSLIYILGCRDLYRCQSGNTNNNEHKKVESRIRVYDTFWTGCTYEVMISYLTRPFPTWKFTDHCILTFYWRSGSAPFSRSHPAATLASTRIFCKKEKAKRSKSPKSVALYRDNYGQHFFGRSRSASSWCMHPRCTSAVVSVIVIRKGGLELDRGITGTGDASKAEPAAR